MFKLRIRPIPGGVNDKVERVQILRNQAVACRDLRFLNSVSAEDGDGPNDG